MTGAPSTTRTAAVRGALRQLLLVVLINVPTISFGLALGWVSLASGASGACDEGAAVAAAVTTFAASLLGVPLSARALARGRRFAVIATSATFVACWSLKLVGGAWCVLTARVAAGLGAAAAWAQAPLLAQEMCNAEWRGAATAAPVPAHNLGLLLMYLAAQARLPHTTVLWWCLALSVGHCFAFLLMPESPAFLAASGKYKEAERSLRWLRGAPPAAVLRDELAALPSSAVASSSWYALAKDMMSDTYRCRAFLIGGFAVVGQEMCGVLALLQYAERVFVLVQEAGGRTRASTLAVHGAPEPSLVSPAGHAVLLGAVQLAASLAGLYLVERIGRRPMIVWSGLATGVCLGVGAASLSVRAPAALGGVTPAGFALAAAVAADSAGLQSAPYALLADMFHYQYRGCAVLLVTAAASAANALEAGAFPLAAELTGLRGALGLAAALTLAYAAATYRLVPETRGRSPEQIYAALCPPTPAGCAIDDKRTQKHAAARFDTFRFKVPTGSSRNGNRPASCEVNSKVKEIGNESDANIGVKEAKRRPAEVAAVAECVVTLRSADCTETDTSRL